jgi:hypothetical protein
MWRFFIEPASLQVIKLEPVTRFEPNGRKQALFLHPPSERH